MKKMILAAALAVTLFAIPSAALSAQHSGESTQGEPKQQEQYQKSMEERFRKLGKQLDELKASVNAKTEQARKDMDRYIADAEKKRKEASRKLNEMKTEGRKKWDKFVDEMNGAMDEFEKAFERAKSHFKE